MRLTALLTLAILIASPSWAQQPTSAPQDASSSTDVSVARVRAALNKPPPIMKPPERKADFTVHIEKRLPLQEIFDTPPWATPPVGWSPPGGWGAPWGIDLLGLVQSARRTYAQHAAREEVKRAIADYCAAQPDTVPSNPTCASAVR
jgi:hypothetical protein